MVVAAAEAMSATERHVGRVRRLSVESLPRDVGGSIPEHGKAPAPKDAAAPVTSRPSFSVPTSYGHDASDMLGQLATTSPQHAESEGAGASTASGPSPVHGGSVVTTSSDDDEPHSLSHAASMPAMPTRRKRSKHRRKRSFSRKQPASTLPVSPLQSKDSSHSLRRNSTGRRQTQKDSLQRMADTTQTIMEGGSPGMTRRNSVGGGAHGMHRRTSSHRIVKAAALAAHHEMNTIGTVQLSKVDAAIRAAVRVGKVVRCACL